MPRHGQRKGRGPRHRENCEKSTPCRCHLPPLIMIANRPELLAYQPDQIVAFTHIGKPDASRPMVTMSSPSHVPIKLTRHTGPRRHRYRCHVAGINKLRPPARPRSSVWSLTHCHRPATTRSNPVAIDHRACRHRPTAPPAESRPSRCSACCYRHRNNSFPHCHFAVVSTLSPPSTFMLSECASCRSA